MKKVTKIVITGGPCAGKTTALEFIKQNFEPMGIGVLYVSETATDLISSGVSPTTLGGMYPFQKALLPVQVAKENTTMDSAQYLQNFDDVLIVCDRGLMDYKAYLTEEEFERLKKECNFTEEQWLSRYEAVFHLVTAANGAEQNYTLANNAARTESIDHAISLDNRTQNAWKDHKNFVVIDNSTGFEEKLMRVANAILDFMNKKYKNSGFPSSDLTGGQMGEE